MLKEFKAFITKGNVLDMAVGLIMATYFGAIIKSFVTDILMPPIGQAIGGVDFNELKMLIGANADAEGNMTEVFISYGVFINTIITFIIVAFAIFLVVKGVASMKKKEAEAPAAPPAPSKEEVLLTEIRDALKK
ncbi:MAG: large conductance mechanosensitive channel [Flavobacteriales bacterium]|jgi:large conductance mechanosensitive channel